VRGDWDVMYRRSAVRLGAMAGLDQYGQHEGRYRRLAASVASEVWPSKAMPACLPRGGEQAELNTVALRKISGFGSSAD